MIFYIMSILRQNKTTNELYARALLHGKYVTYHFELENNNVIEYFRKNNIEIGSPLPDDWHQNLSLFNGLYTGKSLSKIRQTTCNKCRKSIYYYEREHKTGNISKVLFDSLGPEWHKHNCNDHTTQTQEKNNKKKMKTKREREQIRNKKSHDNANKIYNNIHNIGDKFYKNGRYIGKIINIISYNSIEVEQKNGNRIVEITGYKRKDIQIKN